MTGINRREGQTARLRSGRIRRLSEFRGSENLRSSTFTTVEINLKIFFGGCSFDATEQQIFDQVTSKGVRVINSVCFEANV